MTQNLTFYGRGNKKLNDPAQSKIYESTISGGLYCGKDAYLTSLHKSIADRPNLDTRTTQQTTVMNQPKFNSIDAYYGAIPVGRTNKSGKLFYKSERKKASWLRPNVFAATPLILPKQPSTSLMRSPGKTQASRNQKQIELTRQFTLTRISGADTPGESEPQIQMPMLPNVKAPISIQRNSGLSGSSYINQSPKLKDLRLLKKSYDQSQPWIEQQQNQNHDKLRKMIQKHHNPGKMNIAEYRSQTFCQSSLQQKQQNSNQSPGKPLMGGSCEYPGGIKVHVINQQTRDRLESRNSNMRKYLSQHKRNITVSLASLKSDNSSVDLQTSSTLGRNYNPYASPQDKRNQHEVASIRSDENDRRLDNLVTINSFSRFKDKDDASLNQPERDLQTMPEFKKLPMKSLEKQLHERTFTQQELQQIQFNKLIAIEEKKSEAEVQDIVQELHDKHSDEKIKAMLIEQQSLEKLHSLYPMPSQDRLKQGAIDALERRKSQLSQYMSKNSVQMEGMFGVTKLKEKGRLSNSHTLASDYVKNFTRAADANLGFLSKQSVGRASFTFANVLKDKMAENQSNRLEGGIANSQQVKKTDPINKMQTQIAREEERYDVSNQNRESLTFQSVFDKAWQRGSIYQGQEKINKETLKGVVENFEKSFEYAERFKQRNIEENLNQIKNPELGEDPRIKYMKRCLEAIDLNLPILDKIYRKTLCLQDYHLSDGNCQGLADACEFLDHRIINRMLFNNCGLTGDKLAIILEGIAKMKDFKALIYCKQPINALVVQKLIPVIQMRIPYHLEELSFVDTKMGATVIEQLMDALVYYNNKLKKFTLVNVHHSDRSFDKLVTFVEDSCYLKELDLSWQGVRPQNMLKLLKVIEQNRHLVSLTLSYNYLLEDQSIKLTNAEIEAGETEVKLSPFNLEVMNCFTDFIKYNRFLAHLNLERCGLIEPAIRYITPLLRKSQALTCLHLCNNEGLNNETIQWIRQRIHAKIPAYDRQLRPQAASQKYEGSEHGPVNKRGLFKVNRGASIELQSNQTNLKQWRDIREGIKLRNIVQSMRANEVSQQMMAGVDFEKCIIQRKLGHKGLMPGAAQWSVHTEHGYLDECWICAHYIMTVFVWTPRIGQLARDRDPAINTHYKKSLNDIKHTWHHQPGHHDGHPYINGPFTNWEPIRMQDIVEYCIKNDPVKPEFTDDCIADGSVRKEAIGKYAIDPMTDEEKDAVIVKENKYYHDNWHRALLSLIRYKNPSVANTDNYSLMTLKADPEQPIFFHVDFIKPGKASYVVEHSSKPKNSKDQFYEMSAFNDEPSSLATISKNKPPDLYVHHTLTQFRMEDVLFHYNERHFSQIQTDAVLAKKVFKDYKGVTVELIDQIVAHDWERMLINHVVEDEEQLRRIRIDMICNLQMLNEIYVYLRSRSKSYPYLHPQDIQDFFFKELGLDRRDVLIKATIYNFCLETCIQGANAHATRNNDKFLLRHQFIEVLMRMALWMYSNQSQLNNLGHLHSYGAYESLTSSQSWYIFINQKLKPFYEKEQIELDQFRKIELWSHQVELVYTLNENGIRSLFKMYCAKGQNYLTIVDFGKMLIKDAKLQISKKDIRQAFGISQQTIVRESDQRTFENYNQTQYVEFLEFIARIAVLFFRDSELAAEQLEWKVEYILKQLLKQILQIKLKKNHVVIEEFSDSDDDY